MRSLGKLHQLLEETPRINLKELRTLAWPGLPYGTTNTQRARVWQLMLEYIPPTNSLWESALHTKREAYRTMADLYFGRSFTFNGAEDSILDSVSPKDGPSPSIELKHLRQIRADLVRTSPAGFAEIFNQKSVQFVLTRLLYILAVKNPASGYVQGLNDILAPFFVTFLLANVPETANLTIEESPAASSKLEWDNKTEALLNAEADSYHGLSALLSEVQDFYVHDQVGIWKQMEQLKVIIRRIDPPLSEALIKRGINLNQFSFRWFNCLLARELPFLTVTRLWDTYIAEGVGGIRALTIYLAAALLVTFSDQFRKMEFQEVSALPANVDIHSHRLSSSRNLCPRNHGDTRNSRAWWLRRETPTPT